MLRIKTHKNYWSFKKYWIYLQVYGLFTLERLETGLSAVSVEDLFVNTKLRLGLSWGQISKLRLFFVSDLRSLYEYVPWFLWLPGWWTRPSVALKQYVNKFYYTSSEFRPIRLQYLRAIWHDIARFEQKYHSDALFVLECKQTRCCVLGTSLLRHIMT